MTFQFGMLGSLKQLTTLPADLGASPGRPRQVILSRSAVKLGTRSLRRFALTLTRFRFFRSTT